MGERHDETLPVLDYYPTYTLGVLPSLTRGLGPVPPIHPYPRHETLPVVLLLGQLPLHSVSPVRHNSIDTPSTGHQTSTLLSHPNLPVYTRASRTPPMSVTHSRGPVGAPGSRVDVPLSTTVQPWWNPLHPPGPETQDGHRDVYWGHNKHRTVQTPRTL